MSRAIVILLVLFTFGSNLRAIEIWDSEEFYAFYGFLKFQPEQWSLNINAHTISFSDNRELGIIFAIKDHTETKSWISICFVYFYIFLTPTELTGFFFLGLTLLLILVYLISGKTKKFAQKEEREQI